LREFQALMKKEGLSESTAQKEFAMLKVMFNVAMREWSWGSFENPCTGIKLGKSKRRFIKLEAAEREALDAALAQCENPYFWPLVFTAKETTLRLDSLLELRWDSVDLGDRSTLAPTKTGQLVHKFSKPVQELLQTLPRSPCGRIFPLSKTAVTQAWNRVRARANLRWLQFRDLRHIGATDWVRRGLTAHVLSKVLGHSTIVTAQRYVDLVGNDVGRALDEAMENCAPLQLPPRSLPDAKAQQALNSVRRLQKAVAQSREARISASHNVPADEALAMSEAHSFVEVGATADERDATAIFLSVHGVPTLEAPKLGDNASPPNVITFHPRKAA
jgi:integrase